MVTLLGLPSVVPPETTVGTSLQHTGASPFCNAVRPAFVYASPQPTTLEGSDATWDPTSTVVAVNGSGFPANTPVTLDWQPGIGTAAVTTSLTGTFTNRLVLVLPKDELGDRLMVAQTFGATATFLVVPPSISPGGHGGDLQFLFRR